MPPRMFEDLVPSRAVPPGGRARALPFSIVFHGLAVGAVLVLPQLATELPPVKAAPPPPIPTFQRVQVVEVAPPTPPPPGPVKRHTRESAPPTAPVAPSQGTGPSLPADLSQLGDGEIADDDPALCFSNCSGDGNGGAILPGPPDDGGGGGGEPLVRRAGRDVTPPAKLGGNAPAYPELAKKIRLEGDVVIECTIDPSGRVVNMTVTRSIPLLDAAALDAVRSWRYRPTLVDGVPVPVLMTVTVRFRIR